MSPAIRDPTTGRFLSGGGAGRSDGGLGITSKTRTQFHGRKLRRKAEEGNIRSLGHAAAVIRLTAKRSIRKRKGPAPIGSPPHTHMGLLPRAILYLVEKLKQYALIGASHRIIGIAGGEHEIQLRKRKRLPKRPFVGPALAKTAPRLPRHWAGSIR